MVVDNVHTINLGKVILSQRQHRAVRAINMIREYVQKHKNTPNVKIDEELAHLVWARGVRRPPRKVTVEIIDDGGDVLVLPYVEQVTEDLTPLEDREAKAIDSQETAIEDATSGRALPGGASPHAQGSLHSPDARATAEAELDIDDSELDIDDSELDIDDSELDIDDSELDIDDSELDIDDSELDIDDSELDIDDSELDIDDSELDIDDSEKTSEKKQ